MNTRILHPYFRIVLLSFVLTIRPAAMATTQDQSISELDHLGREAVKSGNYVKATGYFRLQLERAESGNAPDETKISILTNLADQLRLTGQYAESERLYGRSLRILRTTANIDKTYAPVILTGQGRMYAEAGKHALAESSLKEALRLTERDLGRRHPQMAQV